MTDDTRAMLPTTHEIKNTLAEHIKSVLLRDPDFDLDAHETLVSSGVLDSFSMTDLLLFVEDEFDVHIPTSELAGPDVDTLDGLVEMIRQYAD